VLWDFSGPICVEFTAIQVVITAFLTPRCCRVRGIACRQRKAGGPAHLTSAVLADEENDGECWSGPLLDQLPDNEEAPYGGRRGF
jgi:hypothetical protein